MNIEPRIEGPCKEEVSLSIDIIPKSEESNAIQASKTVAPQIAVPAIPLTNTSNAPSIPVDLSKNILELGVGFDQFSMLHWSHTLLHHLKEQGRLNPTPVVSVPIQKAPKLQKVPQFQKAPQLQKEVLGASVLAKVQKDLEVFENDIPMCCSFYPTKKSIMTWKGVILGPRDSVYEGGTFKARINFPKNYPEIPPEIIFEKPIFHPNIGNTGKVCLGSIAFNWEKTHTVVVILRAVVMLLLNPNADNGFPNEATKAYKSSKQLFEKKATEWTKLNGNPDT